MDAADWPPAYEAAVERILGGLSLAALAVTLQIHVSDCGQYSIALEDLRVTSWIDIAVLALAIARISQSVANGLCSGVPSHGDGLMTARLVSGRPSNRVSDTCNAPNAVALLLAVQ